MSAKADYFKIGVFILSALTIAILAIVTLSGRKWFKSNVLYWEAYFDESIQGLAVGAPIKYRGVKVGTVDAIDFVGNRYGTQLGKEDLLRYGRFVMVTGSATQAAHLTDEEQKVAHQSNIAAGLRVRLASQGVTGIVHLEADYLDPRHHPVMAVPWTPQRLYVPSAPSTVAVLESALQHLARDVEKADIHKVISDLDALLLDITKLVNDSRWPHMAGQVTRILAEMQVTAEQTRRLVEHPQFARVIEEAAGTVKHTRDLAEDLSRGSRQIMTGSGNLPDTLTRLNMSAQRVDTLLSQKSQDFTDTLENLRVVSENLRETTEDAKRYPAHVLFGDPPPPARAAQR